MLTHNAFPTIQIKNDGIGFEFDFEFIYNRAHHQHEMVP